MNDEPIEDRWPDLLRRLDAIGGMATGEISPWGSREIIAPLFHYDKRLWVSASALEGLLDEWEAHPAGPQPGMAVALFRLAQSMREEEQRRGVEKKRSRGRGRR